MHTTATCLACCKIIHIHVCVCMCRHACVSCIHVLQSRSQQTLGRAQLRHLLINVSCTMAQLWLLPLSYESLHLTQAPAACDCVISFWSCRNTRADKTYITLHVLHKRIIYVFVSFASLMQCSVHSCLQNPHGLLPPCGSRCYVCCSCAMSWL